MFGSKDLIANRKVFEFNESTYNFNELLNNHFNCKLYLSEELIVGLLCLSPRLMMTMNL